MRAIIVRFGAIRIENIRFLCTHPLRSSHQNGSASFFSIPFSHICPCFSLSCRTHATRNVEYAHVCQGILPKLLDNVPFKLTCLSSLGFSFYQRTTFIINHFAHIFIALNAHQLSIFSSNRFLIIFNFSSVCQNHTKLVICRIKQ